MVGVLTVHCLVASHMVISYIGIPTRKPGVCQEPGVIETVEHILYAALVVTRLKYFTPRGGQILS